MKKLSVLLSPVLLFGAAKAYSATIDFNGQSGSASPPGSIASGGFTFTPTSISFGSIFIGGTGSPPNHRVTNGTNNLFALNHTEVNMAETGGLNFSLNSLSVGGSFIVSPNRWADEVDIVGNIAAGGTITHTVTLLNQPAVFQNIVLAGFTGLSSVDFIPGQTSGSGANNFEFELDDIVVNMAVIPEPSEIALGFVAIIGLVAAGFFRRRAG